MLKTPARLTFAVSHPRIELPRATASLNRSQRSVTFKSSGTWVAPAGVSLVPTVQGKGADGKPSHGSHDYVDGYDQWSQEIWHDNVSGENIIFPENYDGAYEGSVPSAHCETYYNGPDYTKARCYRYAYATVDVGDYVAATTGASATAFSKTFSGGVAGAAKWTYFYNIKVAPLTGYPITVPAGGTVTIYY